MLNTTSSHLPAENRPQLSGSVLPLHSFSVPVAAVVAYGATSVWIAVDPPTEGAAVLTGAGAAVTVVDVVVLVLHDVNL